MKIAIAGYGLEGEANYHYWSADPMNNVIIVDEALEPKHPLPEGVETLLGPGVFSQLDGFDLVVRTAGLPPYKIQTNGKVWTATNEFFEKCPAPIVGVTGTKGKGTTASLIASIFEAAGKKVWLVGNIGVAALSVLDQITADDIVVNELSSFQLWDIEKSPHVAVITIIEPDHLNIHTDMGDYTKAKEGIRRFQTDADVCIYHPSNPITKQIAESNQKGRLVRYAIRDDHGVYVKDNAFFVDDTMICSTDSLQLLGTHNRENACAAITAALVFDVVPSAIEAGLRSFHGLPHRLEYVREVDGVKYYNDSFSSAPTATRAAITSFAQPVVVIIGGTDKGSDFSELVDTVKQQPNIKHILLIGEMRHQFADMFQSVGVETPYTILDEKTMTGIVMAARQIASSGDVVLLSPGCASFDMFKDFYDRGDQFRQVVHAL